MSAIKLGVAMALLLSATSAALAQEGRCLGDRPYYGSESSRMARFQLPSRHRLRHRAARHCASRRARPAQRPIAGGDRFTAGGKRKATRRRRRAPHRAHLRCATLPLQGRVKEIRTSPANRASTTSTSPARCGARSIRYGSPARCAEARRQSPPALPSVAQRAARSAGRG